MAAGCCASLRSAADVCCQWPLPRLDLLRRLLCGGSTATLLTVSAGCTCGAGALAAACFVGWDRRLFWRFGLCASCKLPLAGTVELPEAAATCLAVAEVVPSNCCAAAACCLNLLPFTITAEACRHRAAAQPAATISLAALRRTAAISQCARCSRAGSSECRASTGSSVRPRLQLLLRPDIRRGKACLTVARALQSGRQPPECF